MENALIYFALLLIPDQSISQSIKCSSADDYVMSYCSVFMYGPLPNHGHRRLCSVVIGCIMGESRLPHAFLACEPLLALDESHAPTEVDAEQRDATGVCRHHRALQTCKTFRDACPMQANKPDMQLANTDEQNRHLRRSSHHPEEKI